MKPTLTSEDEKGWWLCDCRQATPYGDAVSFGIARHWNGSTFSQDAAGEIVTSGYEGEYSNFRRLVEVPEIASITERRANCPNCHCETTYRKISHGIDWFACQDCGQETEF